MWKFTYQKHCAPWIVHVSTLTRVQLVDATRFLPQFLSLSFVLFVLSVCTGSVWLSGRLLAVIVENDDVTFKRKTTTSSWSHQCNTHNILSVISVYKHLITQFVQELVVIIEIKWNGKENIYCYKFKWSSFYHSTRFLFFYVYTSLHPHSFKSIDF